MSAERLPTRDRLYVQMLNLSAVSDDLRQFPRDEVFKGVVWQLRDLREGVLWRLDRGRDRSHIHSADSKFQWALERVKVRHGLSNNTWWFKGEELDAHTADEDVRLVVEFLESIR